MIRQEPENIRRGDRPPPLNATEPPVRDRPPAAPLSGVIAPQRDSTASYVEAPTEYVGNGPTVFLAGGITHCPDWQREARTLLADTPIVILNPRRANFPIHDPTAAASQIDWEYRHLRRADVVLFWFSDGPSVQPIALYELGAHSSAAGTRIAVGADPSYPRRADVVHQLSLARQDVIVHNTLAATCAEVLRLLAEPSPTLS